MIKQVEVEIYDDPDFCCSEMTEKECQMLNSCVDWCHLYQENLTVDRNGQYEKCVKCQK